MMKVLLSLGIAMCLAVGARAAEADEFFGKPKADEDLPVSGPAPEKTLPSYRFAAKQVTGSWLNPSSALD
jgi:hypothetical protein